MENISSTNSSKQSVKKIKLNFKDAKYATGRRKRSIAKVWVKKGSGEIYVNGKKMNDYFKRPVHQIIVTRPLEISNLLNSYDVKASVKGGGLSGQAGAIIHGLSRALVLHDETIKKAWLYVTEDNESLGLKWAVLTPTQKKDIESQFKPIKLDQTSETTGTQKEKALLKAIIWAEGTLTSNPYTVIYGGEMVPELTSLTADEWLEIARTKKLPVKFSFQ